MLTERLSSKYRVRHPYHAMIKAVGPLCNLDCSYCYYLEKEALYPTGTRFRMDEALLERFISVYIASHPGDTVLFPWHGGEPMLLGIEFYRRALELELKHMPPGWNYVNVIQTNGTLLDEAWAVFLKQATFNVALSLDGPASCHDAFRPDKQQRPTHERVMRGLKVLQEHKVPVTVMCTVNSANVRAPLEVYRFFREHGVAAMQFLPIVRQQEGGGVSAQTVNALEYGQFLVAIFEEWLREGLGTVWVQIFDECMMKMRGEPGALCLFQETCGDSLVLEHDGDVFACDHFVVKEHRLGNVRTQSMKSIVESPKMKRFAQAKRDTLPTECRQCDVLSFCRGGCPKDRFASTPGGNPHLNYLCDGYRHFFRHARDRLAVLFPSDVRQAAAGPQPGRNDPCPCGSGNKFKRCCASKGAVRPGAGN